MSRALGAELVVAYLPSFLEVQPELVRRDPAPVLDLFGLDESALADLRTTGDELVRGLRRQGLRVVDLREAIETLDRPAYWRSDHHLGVVGHRVVARWLLAELDPSREGSG